MLFVKYKLAPSLSIFPLTGVVTKVPAGILSGESVVDPVAKVSIPVNVPPVVPNLLLNVFQSALVKYPFTLVVAAGIPMLGAVAVPEFVIGAVTATAPTPVPVGTPHERFPAPSFISTWLFAP
ncbi:hypothetical protein D3C87_1227760 [compost metagenome]